MRRSLLCCSLVLLLVSFAVAQQKSSSKSKDAPPPGSHFQHPAAFGRNGERFHETDVRLRSVGVVEDRCHPSFRGRRTHRSAGCPQQLAGTAEQPPLRHRRWQACRGRRHHSVRRASFRSRAGGAEQGDRTAHPAARPTLPSPWSSSATCNARIARRPSPPSRSSCRRRKTSAWCSRISRCPSHDWAAKAAYYGDCIGRASPDAFWKYVAAVYDAQKDITASNADEKLTAIAEQSGANGPDTAACAAKPETAARVQQSVALGAALEVTGTPTLFVNGRKISNVSGLPYEVLKGLTEFAAAQGTGGQRLGIVAVPK